MMVVIGAAEGPLVVVECVTRTGAETCVSCPRSHTVMVVNAAEGWLVAVKRVMRTRRVPCRRHDGYERCS